MKGEPVPQETEGSATPTPICISDEDRALLLRTAEWESRAASELTKTVVTVSTATLTLSALFFGSGLRYEGISLLQWSWIALGVSIISGIFTFILNLRSAAAFHDWVAELLKGTPGPSSGRFGAENWERIARLLSYGLFGAGILLLVTFMVCNRRMIASLP